MNKVKNSWLNLIALLVLALFAANAAQKKRTPVYHSTLDSAAAIETPAVGATGVCWNVEFREGVKGNALYVPAGTSTVKVPFNDGLPARAGCVEFWAKILASNSSFTIGGNPRFFNFTTPGTDASSLAFLEINANNGSARGGWHLVFSEVWQTTGYMVYNSYPQIFGDLDYADWHHYVLKWNVDGLATASDKAFVFELDGNTMLSQEKEGLDVDKFCATLSQPLELLLPLQFNTRVPGDCRVPYLIDEFKVWDSDVIGEEEPDPQKTEPLYCVIDLSGGTAAESYPVTYLDAAPTGGWSDEYKTNKIVLRRINPGTYTQTDSVGSALVPELQRSRTTTITKAFYIGVFELTQAQYQNITGENPSRYKGDTRPVEYVSYFQLRGDWPGSLFPVTNTVDNLSFMGVMRARTGLPSIDIPTEAQWEYACRAGTTSAFNNGGDAESDLKLLGRYSGNGEGEHAAVGSYRPNAWGLYDMHGNVWEWCLDWGDIELSTAPATDPRGAADGTKRALRGGSWDTSSEYCAAFARHSDYPNIRNNYGIRLMFPADDLKSISITPEPNPGTDPDPALDDGVDVVDGVTWYYTLDASGNATIVKGAILYAGDLTTPTTLDGHPVKAIGENAFRACPDLVSVVVSDGVETVGKRALSEDPILVCVTMPDSVTFIGIDAFYSSPKLSQMNLPPHVTTVSPFTFHETAITEIVIPEGVTTIGDCAFWQCEQLEEATLPSTLTFMDWGAFHTCPSLKRIEFPEGFEEFGVWTLKDETHAAFGNCTGLEEAVFNGPLPTNFAYSWLDKLGCKIWYPKAYAESWAGAVPAEKFGGYTEDYGNEPGPDDPDPNLNDGVDVVDGVTWYYTLADGVATIVKGATAYAGNPTTPIMLDGNPVKAIGVNAFRACPDLVTVVVSGGVESIGNAAFADCPLLTSVTLPDSVTFIDQGCFYASTKLAQINLPPHITTVNRFSFHDTALTEIVIPEGVTMIGDNTFWPCTKLESVTLPSTLTFIDWAAFNTCSALKRIEFPEGFERFGAFQSNDEAHAAFGNCTGLEEAVFNGPLPANFTYSWLDKLGCKIWYPKAYAESWAGAVPAEKFAGYTEDLDQEIEFKPFSWGGYDVGLDIEPIAVTYNGEAENVKITLAGLPKGLAFKNGVISGAPANPGIYTVTAKVASGRQTVAERVVEFRVKNYTDPLAAGLEDAYGPFIPGVAVDLALDAVKGWKTSGSLPAGLKFTSATGRLAGVPRKPGVYTICFTKKVGIAVHAASATFTIAPLRRVVVEQEGEGTVKGAGSYLANAKAKLSAKPAKGMAVEGWYAGGARISRDAAFTYIVGEEEEQTLTVKYVTVADDLASIACRVGGEAIGAGEAVAVTNYQGVAFSMPVAIDSLTNPKVTVSGLPKGLVYRDGMVSGAPKTASRSGKNGYTATRATFTVKTGAGNSAKYMINFVTLPRPAWAVGTFDGACYDGGALLGSATLTIAANGTVSGKLMRNGATEAFTAAFIKAYDEENGTLAVEVASKSGVLAESAMELLVTHDEDGLGVAAGEAGGLALELAQNAWKRADLAAPAFPSGKGALTCELANGLVLKFGAKGMVTFAGTKVGDGGRIVSLSGKAQLLVRADEESGANAGLVIYVAPKSGLAGGFCCEARLRIAVDEKNVATAVEEVARQIP